MQGREKLGGKRPGRGDPAPTGIAGNYQNYMYMVWHYNEIIQFNIFNMFRDLLQIIMNDFPISIQLNLSINYVSEYAFPIS